MPTFKTFSELKADNKKRKDDFVKSMKNNTDIFLDHEIGRMQITFDSGKTWHDSKDYAEDVRKILIERQTLAKSKNKA